MGDMIFGIVSSIRGAIIKNITSLDFYGKTATKRFVQVTEHWIVGAVPDDVMQKDFLM